MVFNRPIENTFCAIENTFCSANGDQPPNPTRVYTHIHTHIHIQSEKEKVGQKGGGFTHMRTRTSF